VNWKGYELTLVTLFVLAAVGYVVEKPGEFMNLKFQRGFVVSGVITLALALVVVIWLGTRITVFGAILSVDFHTAASIMQRLAAVTVIVVIVVWKRAIARALAYLPFVVLLVLFPALRYWSVNSMPGQQGGAPAWYGHEAVQVIGAILLFAVGYWGPKWYGEQSRRVRASTDHNPPPEN
jgi:hypothetical protein